MTDTDVHAPQDKKKKKIEKIKIFFYMKVLTE